MIQEDQQLDDRKALAEADEERTSEPAEAVLRDLERKRAEIDAAIRAILASHPDLSRRN